MTGQASEQHRVRAREGVVSAHSTSNRSTCCLILCVSAPCVVYQKENFEKNCFYFSSFVFMLESMTAHYQQIYMYGFSSIVTYVVDFPFLFVVASSCWSRYLFSVIITKLHRHIHFERSSTHTTRERQRRT